MGIKVAVGIPFSGRFVPPEFAVALASLQFPMNCNRVHLTAKNTTDSPDSRAKNRTQIIKSARYLGAEYVFFLDDDTVPAPDSVRLLMKELEQNPNAGICAGIYTSRNERPYEPMVFMENGAGPYWRWKFGDVFKCRSIGTGCMLVRCSIFDNIPEPWFLDIQDKQDALDRDPESLAASDNPHEPVQFSMTDDVYLCYKVAKAGYDILAHGGVLPIHYNPDGSPCVMDLKDFPIRHVQASSIWYNGLLPPDYYGRYQESTGDGYPDGFMAMAELKRLQKEVEGLRVLEFGSYKGRSTVAMAETAEQVICVDTFDGTGEVGGNDTLGTFLTNTMHCPNITPIVAPTFHIEALFKDQVFDVVFVDGDHTLQGALIDFTLAKQCGKRILAHDWGSFEVAPAAEAAGLEPLWIEESLVELVPKKEN